MFKVFNLSTPRRAEQEKIATNLNLLTNIEPYFGYFSTVNSCHELELASVLPTAKRNDSKARNKEPTDTELSVMNQIKPLAICQVNKGNLMLLVLF